MKKIILGVVVAIAVFALLFYAIETKKSFQQITIGFLLFVFPFTFLSSFKSATPAFILTLLSLGTIYVGWKYHYFDVFLGVLLAFIVGIPIFYFRVRPYKIFSPSKYKNSFQKKES